MRLVLFQPDIPQNTGALIRLGACLGLPIDVIEPCGFLWDDKRLRRALMDYVDLAQLQRHTSWQAYARSRPAGRLIVLTTSAADNYADAVFRRDDRLLVGRESGGVPEQIHASADLRLRIPMVAGARSLNVSHAAALVAGEALRQTGWPSC